MQHIFDLDEYRCVSGETLRNVKVGYETYGALNPDRSNAILVCHYFSGNARAAGPADDDHDLPGWWDKIIGPGKALDTALEMAEQIAKNAPLSLSISKKMLRGMQGLTEEEFWKLQAADAGKIFASEDAREGAVAFAEKREPVWKGR